MKLTKAMKDRAIKEVKEYYRDAYKIAIDEYEVKYWDDVDDRKMLDENDELVPSDIYQLELVHPETGAILYGYMMTFDEKGKMYHWEHGIG